MTRLRECRENARLSQKYVALTLGIAAPSVANWERGKTNPSYENIVKLADLYGVSVDYLLGRSDDPHRVQELLKDIGEKLQSAGYFLGVEGDESAPGIGDIDFALSGEIRDLTDDEKQDVLDYVRFKRAQKARQEAKP